MLYQNPIKDVYDDEIAVGHMSFPGNHRVYVSVTEEGVMKEVSLLVEDAKRLRKALKKAIKNCEAREAAYLAEAGH